VKRRLVGLALLLAGMFALAACGGTASQHTSTSSSPTSGVYGIALKNPVTASPTPSPLPGGFGEAEGVPCPHAAILIRSTGGHDAGGLVTRVRADAQGIFRVSLPPGRYLAYGRGLRYTGSRFTVRPGVFTRVLVVGGIVRLREFD